MPYKRRRERSRTRPKPGEKRRPSGARHSGPFMGVPPVIGSAEMGVSSSGELEERKPPSAWVRLVLLPVAVVATASFAAFIMTDLWFLLWAGLGVFFVGMIYKTWRD